MAFTCPLTNLPAVTSLDDVDELDKFRSTGRIYWKADQPTTLDYFEYFLDRGKNVPTKTELITNPEHDNCNWKVDDGVKDVRYHWPMTRTDCVLGYTAIEDRASVLDPSGVNAKLQTSLTNLKRAVRNYHDVASDVIFEKPYEIQANALIYALSVLSGDGTPATIKAGPAITAGDGFCGGNSFPAGGTIGNKFGAYFTNSV
jgi:hypothetical protein